MPIQSLFNKLKVLAALGALCILAGTTLPKGKPASWKVIEDALFRVNDAPVKEWGVYQAGKKRDPLLLQMDKRLFLIKIHDREIFEVNPAKVQRKSDELLWDPSEHAPQPLATSDWDARDTEAVFRIRVKVAAEDRLLDIELPHPLDLSGMSPHQRLSK